MRTFAASLPNYHGKSIQTHHETFGVQTQTVRLSEKLFETHVRFRPDGRHHRRHRRAAAGYRVRHRLGRIAREGHRHGHPRRTGRLAAGRKPRTDRRAYGRIHRHHIRHHPAIRRGGPDRRHADGRRAARTDGRLPARSRHQVHPLPRRRRLHERHRRDDLHDADCRRVRSGLRRREGSGRLCRQVAALFPPLRHGRLGERRRQRAERADYRVESEILEENTGIADRHRRRDRRRLLSEAVRRYRRHRHDRRPLHDPTEPAGRRRARTELGSDQEPVSGSRDDRRAGRHRVVAVGHRSRRRNRRPPRLEYRTDRAGSGQSGDRCSAVFPQRERSPAR